MFWDHLDFDHRGALFLESMKSWGVAGETLGVALAGAGLFYLLEMPLPFVLGPMAAVLLWRLRTGRTLAIPSSGRNGALLVLGVMLAAPITRETAGQMVLSLPLMLLATLLTIGFSLLLGVWVARRAGISLFTGLFGQVPGGLTQMVLLSEEVEEVDATAVTVMQTTRLLGVVFLVPFLAVHGLADTTAAQRMPVSTGNTAVGSWGLSAFYVGLSLLAAWAGQKWRLPTAFMVGPVFVTTGLVLLGLPAPHLPSWLLVVAQVVIGSHVGLLLKPESLRGVHKLLGLTLCSTVGIVLFALLLGWGLTLVIPVELTTGFLSVAPGGMAEMGVTAHAVGADTSMVTGYHLFRIFFIMFVMPPLLRWWVLRRKPVV
jgi:membrane AbrB-like protein